LPRRRVFLEEFADRNAQRFGNPPQRFGAGLKAPVFDARQIRGGDARALADLLLR
jgi:hypothetical protein